MTSTDPRAATADRLQRFGATIFGEMSALAREHEAINLGQGFPDFEGPPEIVEAACRALRSGHHNQYARSMGERPFVEAVSAHREHFYGLKYDPLTEVNTFCGATEGIASTLLGILNPGDEVVLFEPFYDSYPVVCAMAGATVRHCTLRFPDFAVDFDELAACFSDKTRVLVLNTPHNPTGKVFTRDELERIAALSLEHDVIVLADEVYEHLTFDGVTHLPMACIDGMKERTIALSSAGKSFSFTGWKIGWATGPTHLIQAAQAAHQFMTFAIATPLQHAVAEGLRLAVESDYVERFQTLYGEKRAYLLEGLRRAGFDAAAPRGTYFIVADFSRLFDGDDMAFARHLTENVGVAVIPPSPFYEKDPSAAARLTRFAFCKTQETLEAAVERLERMAA